MEYDRNADKLTITCVECKQTCLHFRIYIDPPAGKQKHKCCKCGAYYNEPVKDQA